MSRYNETRDTTRHYAHMLDTTVDPYLVTITEGARTTADWYTLEDEMDGGPAIAYVKWATSEDGVTDMTMNVENLRDFLRRTDFGMIYDLDVDHGVFVELSPLWVWGAENGLLAS